VFDDVERRAFLVQPAREDASPAPVGALDVELDERAGQPLDLPRRGRVAGAQADYGVLGADRLAWLEREIADNPVALVEKGDHRHPLRHRGYPFGRGRRHRHIDCHRLARLGFVRTTVAGGSGEAERSKSKKTGADHAWSGRQAL
jgi:hypothetical protein